MTQRDRLIVLLAAIIGHLGLGLFLYGGPMFTKYPDIVRGLRAGASASLPSDASPMYLALNMLAGPWAIRILQILVGIAAVLAIAETAARLRSRTAGLVAGLVAAVAQPLLLYEATLEPDALLASFAVLALSLTVATQPIAAGVLAGLMTALRPTAGAPVLVLALWLWRVRGKKPALLLAGAALLAAGVPLAIVRASFGGQASSTMSFGQVLAEANMPEGVGDTFYEPLIKPIERQMDRMHVAGGDLAHEVYRMLARASQGRELDASQAERFWAKKALALPRLHPSAWLRLESYKARLLFGPVENHDIVPVARAAQRTAPLVPAFLLYPLGCCGLVLLALSRGGRLPALCALAAAAPYLVFSVVPRYRLVLAPLCCIGIGVLAAAVIAAVRSRERAAVGRLAIAALVSLVLVIPPAPLRAMARAAEKGMASSVLAERGVAARRRGDLVEAGRWLADAIGEQPLGFEVLDLRGLRWEEPSFWRRVQDRYQRELSQSPSPALEYEAGLVDEWAGAYDTALRHYERAAAGGYYLRGADPEYSAGRLLLELHRFDDATTHIGRSLDHHPGALASLVAAEVLARHHGDIAHADALAREAEALHDRISTGWARARVWRWLGDARMALAEIARIPEPENALVRWEECLDRLETGDEMGALHAYERALALLPMHPFAASRLDAVIARQLSSAPGDPGMLRLAGEHALRRGRIAEAIDHYRAAIAADPQLGNDPELSSHLALAELAQRRGSPAGGFLRP